MAVVHQRENATLKRGFNEKLDSLHSRMDQLYMLVADMRTAIHTMQKTIGSIEEVMESNFDFIPSWDSPRQPSADEATSKEQSTEEVVVANKEQDDEESVKSVSTDTNTQTETRTATEAPATPRATRAHRGEHARRQQHRKRRERRREHRAVYTAKRRGRQRMGNHSRRGNALGAAGKPQGGVLTTPRLS